MVQFGKVTIWIAILVSIIGGCQLVKKDQPEDRLLAKVHNKTLYLSELDGMFPDETTPEDSALIINAYVERWIREALLLHEAEKNIPSDLNIDKLVRDYRASLVRHTYEKIIVEQLLDSTVTADELVAFYEQHKEQYLLDGTIVRCHLVKVSVSAPEVEKVKTLWNNLSKKDSYFELSDYCNQFAQVHLLEDSTWYRIENIAAFFPKGMISVENVSRREVLQKDNDYYYFLKILDVKNKNELAPLSFVKEEIRKTILRDRKIKLLEDKKEAMYELELQRNNITIYTQ